MEDLQAEVEQYPTLAQRLGSIRYYLQEMIHRCEQSWGAIAGGITNYKTLLDRIERWRGKYGQVCLVTFNYDTMLETALPIIGITVTGLGDYISHKYLDQPVLRPLPMDPFVYGKWKVARVSSDYHNRAGALEISPARLPAGVRP